MLEIMDLEQTICKTQTLILPETWHKISNESYIYANKIKNNASFVIK